MINQELFRGELVRLAAEETEAVATSFSRWSRNSEYRRLADSGASVPFSVKATRKWVEEVFEKITMQNYFFAIRTLEDDRFIGDIGLDGVDWNHGEAFVGIGIGEREAWGKGYGTDAMRIVLGFAFGELNLRRVSLNAFEYNPRAIRSYEKAGFKHEGRMREFLNRDGRRWDLLFMGILQDEWRMNNDRIVA